MQKISQLNKFDTASIWVNWYWKKDDKGKMTKVPIGKTDDPSTWKPFKELDQDKLVGIVFSHTKTLLGIDIDHCLEKGTTNIIHPLKEIIAQLIIEADTYTEISISGTGLHLFLSLSGPLDLGRNKIEPFEAYTSGRYFVVTGEAYKKPIPVRNVTPAEALRILSITGHDWSKTEADEVFKEQPKATTEDEILMEKMFNSQHGDKIKKLFDGDTSDYKNDRSSADMALCSHLAYWTGGNALQMDRIWLKSPLSNREKAIVRKDYRPRTIANAIKNCKNFYKPEINQRSAKGSVDSLVFLKASDVVCREIDWLWRDKIAKGKVTLIAGDPGLGKSQATLQFASIVSNGGEFPGGHQAEKGKVLIFSAEDDPADTVVPRLKACDADLNQISIFSLVNRGDKEGYFNLRTDISLLSETFKKEKNISLIVIDPITAFLGETDTHKNAEVRSLLYQLSKFASEFNVAVLGVTHFSKNENSSPMNKFTGSLAFVAAARAAYIVTKDSDDESRRLFLPVKNNLADDKGGFAYKVETIFVEKDGVKIKTSRVVWEKEPVKMSALEALKGNNPSGVSNETVTWLEDYLRKNPNGVSTDKLEREAKRNGISRATLYRAEKKTFIEKIYVARDKPKVWKLAFNDEDVDPDSVPI